MNEQAETKTAKYDPWFFDVSTLEEAKGVIVGPEPDGTVAQRWERETPYFANLIFKHLNITKESVVFDYGCGVGRLSAEVCKKFGCRVVGVDFMVNMRALATNYVDNTRFLACDQDMLELFAPGGFDAAIACWVLQHCLNPKYDLALITLALKPGGRLFVANDKRLVPTDLGFITDKENVQELLREHYTLLVDIPLDEEKVGKMLAPRSFCGIYEKKAE